MTSNGKSCLRRHGWRQRNRMMLALIDAALRREELCGLDTCDVDPAHRSIRIRAENTKTRRERVVPYSLPTADLLAAYLHRRREITREAGLSFISESAPNRGESISICACSKVVEGISERYGVLAITTQSYATSVVAESGTSGLGCS